MSRSLSDAERALWARVAATVEPMTRRIPPPTAEGDQPQAGGGAQAAKALPSRAVPLHPRAARRAVYPERPACRPAEGPGGPPPRTGEDRKTPPLHHGLDASWDRRLAKGQAASDFTLDLHGCTLDQAHVRLDHGLTLAVSQGARVVLLVTGRARPSDDHASRSERRGAIRAKFLDWIAAGPHASRIAAIRPAHPRHGGGGAVYLIMRAARKP